MAVPTLSDFFYTDYMKYRIVSKVDHKTKSSYEESVAHWVRITGDPPLTEITDDTCMMFVLGMSETRGKQPGSKMMKSSISKHVINIKTILQFAGPRTPHFRGRSIILDVPYMDAPKVEMDAPSKDWNIEEIRAMVAAAEFAKLPKDQDVSAREWWQAFIPFAYGTGFRIGTCIALEFAHINGQWITAPGSISKGGRGKKQYMRADVLEKVLALQRPGRDVIFGWVGGWEHRRRMAYDELRRIQLRAGIPKHRRWGFHSFRATHCSYLADGDFDPEQGIRLAQQSAGHASASITRGHYISGRVQQRLAAMAIEMLPSPFPQPTVSA